MTGTATPSGSHPAHASLPARRAGPAPATLAALTWVALVVLLVYLPAQTGPMQFDDYATLAVDPGSQRLDAWWQAISRHVRPLTKLSFVLTSQVGLHAGNPVLAHHLGSLFIHLVNCLLVGWLACELAARHLPSLDAGQRRLTATGSALLFGLHPAATEAVSYLSGRSMALGLLFATLALLAQLRGHRWLALAAMLAAIASRETMALMLPVAALLQWSRRDRPAPAFSLARLRMLRPMLAGLLLVGAAAAGWLLANDRYALLLELSADNAGHRLDLPSLVVALRYFGQLLLLLRYPNIDPDIALLMPASTRWLVGGGLVLAGALAWRLRASRPEWAIGLSWILALLVPLYLLAIRHDAVADRHLYPALVPAAWLVTCSIARLPRGRRTILVLLALVLATVTVTRNADYRSEVALWEATARGAPDKPRVLNNLGAAYLDAQRWDEAQAVLQRATELDPGHDLAAENLIRAHERGARPAR